MLLPLILFAQSITITGCPAQTIAIPKNATSIKIPACGSQKITVPAGPAGIAGPQGIQGPAGAAAAPICTATAPCTITLTNANYVQGQPPPQSGWQIVITRTVTP